MIVRLVSCGVRECRQASSYRSREIERDRENTNKQGKKEGRKEEQ
jgi:hypothetical protein